MGEFVQPWGKNIQNPATLGTPTPFLSSADTDSDSDQCNYLASDLITYQKTSSVQ